MHHVTDSRLTIGPPIKRTSTPILLLFTTADAGGNEGMPVLTTPTS